MVFCDVGERNGEMSWRLWEMFRVGRVSSAEDDVKWSKPEVDALERVLEGGWQSECTGL